MYMQELQAKAHGIAMKHFSDTFILEKYIKTLSAPAIQIVSRKSKFWKLRRFCIFFKIASHAEAPNHWKCYSANPQAPEIWAGIAHKLSATRAKNSALLKMQTNCLRKLNSWLDHMYISHNTCICHACMHTTVKYSKTNTMLALFYILKTKLKVTDTIHTIILWLVCWLPPILNK